MLAELPVVASEVSSIPEIVVDGETGLLVKPDDVSGLAAALNELLGNPELCATYGHAGLARARREFSVARMADRTAEVYRIVLGLPPAAISTTASAHESTE